MYSKLKYIFPILLVVFLFFLKTSVDARSGCCSWHGGVCGCGCCDGTALSATCAPYYPSCGGSGTTTKPVYVAPKCDKPDLSSTTGRLISTEVNCKQNVAFSWSEGIGDSKYSIALSKTKGADPGPTADTYSRTMTFKDVSYGKWYVNVKGGNSCGWSNVYNWEIDVPKVNVVINRFSTNKRSDGVSELKFNAKCGTSYSISPDVGYLTQAQIKQGYVGVTPKKDTTYTLTVTGNGQTKKSTVTATAPTPTPTPIPTIELVIDEPSEDVEEIVELAEDEEESTIEQEQSGFWDTVFSDNVLLTIARLFIFKF